MQAAVYPWETLTIPAPPRSGSCPSTLMFQPYPASLCFSCPQAFAISKYFCADLIVELGRLDATDDAVLQKLAELNMAQAEPGCKGVRRSYMELLQLAKRRKDEELETSMKAALTKVTTGAPAAAGASAQAPPPPPPPPPAAVAAAAAPAKESGTDAAPEPAMASA